MTDHDDNPFTQDELESLLACYEQHRRAKKIDFRPLIAASLHTWLTPRGRRKTTSIKAARELCAVAASYIEAGEPMPEPLRGFVADALRKIAQGDDARKCLRVGGQRGQSKREDPIDVRERERVIHNRIVKLMVHENLLPDAAYRKVCAELASRHGDFASPLFGEPGVEIERDESWIGKIYRDRRVILEGVEHIYLG